MEQVTTLEQLREKFNGCLTDIFDDSKHDKKRLISFTLLDYYLESCKDGICPNISQECHKFLIDISIASYIQQRIYYYGIDNIGMSHQNREEMASNKILKIFSCPNSPKLNAGIFDFDKSQLIGNDSPDNYTGARKRKAYWAYLKRNEQTATLENHDPYLANLDYFEAEYLISSLVADNKHTQQHWMNNFHILNGFDLFRYCFRKNLRND